MDLFWEDTLIDHLMSTDETAKAYYNQLTELNAEFALPYVGGSKMLLVDDVDNKDFLCELYESMYEELPAPKKKIRGRIRDTASEV